MVIVVIYFSVCNIDSSFLRFEIVSNMRAVISFSAIMNTGCADYFVRTVFRPSAVRTEVSQFIAISPELSLKSL